MSGCMYHIGIGDRRISDIEFCDPSVAIKANGCMSGFDFEIRDGTLFEIITC